MGKIKQAILVLGVVVFLVFGITLLGSGVHHSNEVAETMPPTSSSMVLASETMPPTTSTIIYNG